MSLTEEKYIAETTEISKLMIARLADDPAFRDMVLEDPAGALEALGVKDKVDELETWRAQQELGDEDGDDVAGHKDSVGRCSTAKNCRGSYKCGSYWTGYWKCW